MIFEGDLPVMLENHPNTFPEPALTPMKASREKATQMKTQTYGRPLLLVRKKICGALRETARPSG